MTAPDKKSLLQTLTKIDQPIGESKSVGFVTKHIWAGAPLDGLIFSPPMHDGEPLDVARQVYHRLAARIMSAHIYKVQTYILFACAVASGFFAGRFVDPTMGFGVGVLSAVGFLWFVAPLLTRKTFSQNVDEASEIIERTFFRSLAFEAPEDLRDRVQQGWLTLDGRPLSAELSAEDGKSTEASTRTMWWIATSVAVGVAVSSVLSGGTLGSFGSFGGAGLAGLLFVLKLVFDKHPLAKRASELEVAEAVEGAAYAAAGGKPWGEIAENARVRQVQEALNDPTPLVTLGTTTGILGGRGDFYAPNKGLPFRLSLRDLQNHLLVLGGTGSGKTSGILRPLAYQLSEFENVGLVILDGKSALPLELRDISDLTLIDPAKDSVSLVADLEPDRIVDTITQILAPSSSAGERFWVDSASGLLRRAAVLGKAAGGHYWTLESAARIASDQTYRDTVVSQISEDTDGPVLDEAADFFSREWQVLDIKTQSNIIATMRAWMSAITASPDMLKWASSLPGEDTVDITSPLHGGRIGIVVPQYRYGSAGAVVTALLKARIYARLKARAETPAWQEQETPVVFLVDEAQEIATEEDATMLAIGRSLGLAVVGATQTVESVIVKLGDALARKWLGIYGGVVGLPGRSVQTDEFVASRGGARWHVTLNQIQGFMVRDALTISGVTGASAAAKRQPHMADMLQKGKVTSLPSRIQEAATALIQGMLPAKKDPTGNLGVVPLVTGGELQTLLAEPDTALVFATRARVLRRDVIRLTPRYPSA